MLCYVQETLSVFAGLEVPHPYSLKRTACYLKGSEEPVSLGQDLKRKKWVIVEKDIQRVQETKESNPNELFKEYMISSRVSQHLNINHTKCIDDLWLLAWESTKEKNNIKWPVR